MTTSDSSPAPGQAPDLQEEIRDLIVTSLNLTELPADISGDTPLYGDGLGLDSIDILEVALLVSKRYGLQLRADDGNNVQIFKTLGSLAKHIAANRTK